MNRSDNKSRTYDSSGCIGIPVLGRTARQHNDELDEGTPLLLLACKH